LLSAIALIPVAAVPAAAASAPAATPVTALASTVLDPVFAAIEAHVRALAAFNTVLDDLAAAEQAAWHAPRGAHRAAKKRLAAAHAAERRFGDGESDAFNRFVATVPQTLEGAIAALRYVRGRLERNTWEEDECVTFFVSLEECLAHATYRRQ
jgi:hypothetical protein